MKKLFGIVCMFVALASAYAATPEVTHKQKEPQTVADAPQLPKFEVELQVARAQSAMMKEYHSSLLDTVYWALGTVVAVAALLVGYGWLSNFKFHEAEKQRLKEELEASLTGASSKLEARLSTKEAELITMLDSRLESFYQRVLRDIDNSKSELASAISNNQQKLTLLEGSIESLKESDQEGRLRDLALNASLRRVEENVWELMGIPTNILITQAQGLEANIEAQNSSNIKSSLERMEDTLAKSVLPSKATMNEYSLQYIRECLGRAAVVDRITASRVQTLVDQVPVIATKATP